MRLKDTNRSIVPQDVHRPPCGHNVPYTALEYPSICDHLVLRIESTTRAASGSVTPSTEPEESMLDSEDVSVVSFRCRGPGVFIVALVGSLMEVGIDTGRTTTT